MITGFQSGMPSAAYASQTTSMTEEQTTQVKTLLAEYDGTSLTADDAQDLVTKIREMGVNPGEELAQVLSDSGIDAQDLAELAGISGPGGAPEGGPDGPPKGGGGPGGGGPSGAASLDETVVSLIADAAEAYEESQEDQSFAEYLTSVLDEQGYDTSKPVIDYYA